MYLLLFLVGAFGFVAMTFLGLSHGVGGFHHGGEVSIGHGHGVAGHIHGGAAHALPAHGGAPGHGLAHGSHTPASAAPAHTNSGTAHHPSFKMFKSENAGWSLLMALSPMNLFSLAMGAGATGLLFQGILSASNLVFAAIAGALVFNLLMIKPLMGLLGRFASRPSEGLEGTVASLGEAITRFDSTGKGLVKLDLDGQLVQLLARLDESELSKGVTVAKGEEVLVLEVDPTRNSCRVSRELVSPLADGTAPTQSQVR